MTHSAVKLGLFALLASSTITAAAQASGPFNNPSYTPAERAANLVAHMTLSEKASQMISSRSDAIPRLGIPSYAWWNEALHGPNSEGFRDNSNPSPLLNTTSYPVSLSLASTWNPALAYQEASMIANEMREIVPEQSQNLNLYSPQNVNLMRDPRWGRSDETLGEDPYLTGRVGAQVVDGLEGKTHQGTLLARANGYRKADITLKHYTANNSETNRRTGSSDMSQRELRDYYTAQFRNIIQRSHPASLMSSYNEINGTPSPADVKLNDSLARKTFGFDGFFTADCDAIYEMQAGHHWVPPGHTNPVDHLQRAAFANAAGEDLECQQGYHDQYNYANSIPMALDQNINTPVDVYNQHDVNVSVARLMQARIRLGGLDFIDDNDVPWIQKARQALDGRNWTNSNDNNAFTETPRRLAMTRAIADRSIVLLKNQEPAQQNGESSKLLPLQVPQSGDYKVAVVGQYARKENMYLGDYSSIQLQAGQANMIAPYQGLKNAITAIDPDATVDYLPDASGNAAANYDVAIVVAGTNGAYASEGNDRDSLEFPDNQAQMINRVAAQNANTIVYMVTDGAMNISAFKDNVPAMLWSSFNGMHEGQALADVVLGRYNPSGHLPFTWYKSDAQLAPIKDYTLHPHNGRPGRTYEYFEGTPDYPFGYGQSYTSFKYSGLEVSKQTDSDGDPMLKVTARVTNTGDVQGATVPQLYVVSPDASKTQVPNKRLRGFDKVSLKPGEHQQLSFTVPVRKLSIYEPNVQHQVVHTGTYQLQLGTSSADDAVADQTSVAINTAPSIKPQTVTLQARAASDSSQAVARRILFEPGMTIIPRVAVAMSNQKLYGYIHRGQTTPPPDGMTYTFSSNRPSVVSVQSGHLTTQGAGVATITATAHYQGHTAQGQLAVDVEQQ